MERMKKNNKSSKKFLVPFFLLVLSIILLTISFEYVMVTKSDQTSYYKESGAQYNGITVLTQEKQWINLNPKSATELLANNKISESFTAQDDNLGIIAIPFDAHNRSINDRIIFRIKENGSKSWYFQNTYNADQFQTNVPFPFGFPIIKNSRNKAYTFQIESLAGTSTDSISISKTNPYFLTKYKFSKEDLIKNPVKLFQFLVAKNSEQAQPLTMDKIILIIIYFLSPFIVYACVYDIYIRKEVNNI
jgi:hypothetical protein